MSNLLIKNIGLLFQATTKQIPLLKGKELNTHASIENAFLFIENGKISFFGNMEDCPDEAEEVVDADGGYVLPTWCDSHTHLVFAKSREGEFVDRIKGLSYQEIAEKGGGILNSAKALQGMSEEELFEAAKVRLNEVIQKGTGAIEIKSGYGLTVESEIKMLRVIKRLKAISPIPIKATFLGAHSLPLAYRKGNRQDYVDLIIHEMLPKIAEEQLADYIDVFCEKVAFSVEETDQILKAGAKYGLKPKVHTNQFNCMGGIEICIANNAISVDHLEVVNDEEIAALKKADTIATILPSAPFFLNDHYPPGRKLVDNGLAIALATDFNPGSSPSDNMSLAVALACIKSRLLPVEAINAATINGAYAMELERELGSITIGKRANLIITHPIPSLAYLPYRFGSNLIAKVFINGRLHQS